MLATLPRAMAYAVSLVRDRHIAEDLVQDCYCRILRKSDTYDITRDGARILFRSITHASIDWAKRKRPLALDDLDGLADQRRPPDAVRPDAAILERELNDAVAAGLSQLPLMLRAAWELRVMGLGLKEVAEALDITPNYAGVLVHRARTALASHLSDYLEIEEHDPDESLRGTFG